MKRGYLFVVVAAILLLFCSCEPITDYCEPNSRIMIASLGFDASGGALSVTAEAINVYDNTSDIVYEPLMIYGGGDTASDAVKSLTEGISKELFFGHMAVVALSDGLNDKQRDDVLNYCFKNSDISMAVKVVCAEDTSSLLKIKGVSNPVTGYDIWEILSANKNLPEAGYSRLLDVQNAIFTEQKYTLPYFSVEKNDDSDRYYLSGSRELEGE